MGVIARATQQQQHIKQQYTYQIIMNTLINKVLHPLGGGQEETVIATTDEKDVTINPTTSSTIEKTPIVEETQRVEKKVEVQPVIHREVLAPEVHHIEKHEYEKVASNTPAKVTKKALVEETIKPHVINEVTTVVHREVPVVDVEHVEEHISETDVLPVLHTKEVVIEPKITHLPAK